MSNDIKILLELINKIVNADGKTWEEKRQSILNGADEKDKANLTEFSAWFDDTMDFK